jgi:hypothetical protein
MRELIWAGQIPVVRGQRSRKIYVDIMDLTAFVDQNKTTFP